MRCANIVMLPYWQIDVGGDGSLDSLQIALWVTVVWCYRYQVDMLAKSGNNISTA